MKTQDSKVGVFLAIGAGLGVAFMPMLGPGAIAIGVAIGLVLGAAIDAQTSRR
jgi:hypothetical protein